MAVTALDWNATRVRAVSGPLGDYAFSVPLDPPTLELPLAIHGQRVVGSAALRQCKQTPTEVCQAFLPYLTWQSGQGPRWQSLDARSACEIVWRKLQPVAVAANAKAVLLTVPGYMQSSQADTLRRLGEQAPLPMLGSIPTTLAAALAGHVEQFWHRSVLVIDVDEYALTVGWVTSLAEKAHLIDTRSFPHLGLRFWHDRLINTLSDLFVWQHRRDPRDVPQAEQSLYDQLELLIDAALQRRAIQLGIQGPQWFKHLLVYPEQTMQFCAPLVKKIAGEAEQMLLSAPVGEMPRGILLTHQAGRLPGLVESLRALSQTNLPKRRRTSLAEEEDFGENLLFDSEEEPGGVLVLAADSPARAAHGLAELFCDGMLPVAHLETIVPLTPPPPVDAGPPRLHYRGHDYFLRDARFVIGAQYGCHLFFDRAEHPDVADRHCEIIFEHRAFALHCRSREPTLVNDRPVVDSMTLRAGDLIRLGLRGPTVQFLGKSVMRPVTMLAR
jgi:hypothetical protein